MPRKEKEHVNRVPRGRPTSLTLDVADQIVRAVERRNRIDTSAALAGVHRDTLHAWMVAGRKPDAPENLRQFVERLDCALAKAEDELIATIDRHALQDWRAAAWLAERRFSARWGVVPVPDWQPGAERRVRLSDGRVVPSSAARVPGEIPVRAGAGRNGDLGTASGENDGGSPVAHDRDVARG